VLTVLDTPLAVQSGAAAAVGATVATLPLIRSHTGFGHA
jgi:hypothetical protein